MRSSLNELSSQIVEHSLPKPMSAELQQLLVTACHRITKVRDIAAKYLNRLITSFPSLMCDAPLVCAILEVLTLLRRACEGEYMDEVSKPSHAGQTVTRITIASTTRSMNSSHLGQI